MGSDTKTTTTTGSNEPWDEAQPLLKTGLSDAKDLYSSGQVGTPWTGSSVVPFADQTVAGMTDIQNTAADAMANGSGMDKAYDFHSGMFDGYGLSTAQQGVMDQWGETASGSELNNLSPAFNDVMRRTLDDTRTNVDLSTSGAGRYGSGKHTDVLADAMGGISSGMRLDEYGRQLGRMDQARGNVFSGGQQGIQNQFGSAEALPGAWQSAQAPARDMMTVGSMYEDLAQRTMSDNERIFRETRDAPLKAIEWLNAIGSGAGNFGTESSSTQSPTPNPFLAALTAAAGAKDLFS